MHTFLNSQIASLTKVNVLEFVASYETLIYYALDTWTFVQQQCIKRK